MKVLVAIDSFKGSVSSVEASKAVSLGIRDVFTDAEILSVPLADGGEGTVEALVHAADGHVIKQRVTGSLNQTVDAEYGILSDGKTAVIEVSSACGLPLVPIKHRNPLITTTYGVGELICDAIERGCRHFIIGLGGSATNDAGIGMLQALGYNFLDKNGESVGLGGGELRRIRKIDTTHVHPVLKSCTFKVACDVTNPLYGPNGATYVYGPQKGATPEMLEELDAGMESFSQVAFHKIGLDIQSINGAGAAGGLGAAFAGFLQAQLQSGIELVMELANIEEKLGHVDFVVTGEGKIDGQTSMGKAPLGLSKLAQKHGIPVIALAGAISEKGSTLNSQGITALFSIMNEPMSLEEAMAKDVTSDHLRFTTCQLFRLIRAIR
ncbi:glycerate kinase [Bacillus pakistanensis]|uniref:Glycerate kinase n=1 Tax=Rossellomorea pakistanensis TaxID=992288 RepID=A0ABS2NC69_9BACI|nr:glycerate kinase [Bacillus pakistanensis]MBM7585447.1 glycerate kinase [Bacillus pakistanensis]